MSEGKKHTGMGDIIYKAKKEYFIISSTTYTSVYCKVCKTWITGPCNDRSYAVSRAEDHILKMLQMEKLLQTEEPTDE